MLHVTIPQRLHSTTLRSPDMVDFVERGRSILILYASETGVAADLAKDVTRTLLRYYFDAKCIEANDLDPFTNLPAHNIVIFVSSTTGQGEIPTNAKGFWKKFLAKRLPADWLEDTEFTTFGCGDSAYPRYNAAARKIHSRFLQLGAKQFAGRGEGDEQHSEGIDGSFLPWMKMLVETLTAKYPLPLAREPKPSDHMLEPEHFVYLANESHTVHVVRDVMKDLHAQRPASRSCVIVGNKRVTAEDHWQDVRLISIGLPNGTRWSPGDIVSLSPKNFPDDVEQFLFSQGWSGMADYLLKLNSKPNAAIKSPLPSKLIEPLTLRTLLTHYLDINAIPRRSFFSMVANFSQNEIHKERLLEFVNPAYLDDFYEYTTRPRRSILEVLQEFSSVKIPLYRLLDVIPIMRDRSFSIANSMIGSSLNPVPRPVNHLDILVAVVKYKTTIKKIRQGVCTRWLASLTPGDRINVVVQLGNLVPHKISDLYDRPVVMIAPGTGIAPMRSLIWDRVLCDKHYMKNTLIFGCRGKDADFYLKDEWAGLVRRDCLRLNVAFSRDQQQKRYVQHVIKEQADHLWERIFTENAVVYVCGSSGNMPAAVREALLLVFQDKGKCERKEALEYLLRMEKDGRYRQETW